MYDVDSPHDFGEWLLDEDRQVPDDVDLPDEHAVNFHESRTLFISVARLSGISVLWILGRIDSAGLRPNWTSRSTLGVFPKRPTCSADGCYADAQGGSRSNYPDRCPGHAREANEEYLQAGGTPRR